MTTMWKSTTAVLVLCWVQVFSKGTEYPAKYPSELKKVSFTCENSFVNLRCYGPNERIRILIANYGRFSLVVCGQGGIDSNWSVQCSAENSMKIVTERCNGKKQCTFRANDEIFGGDPCPGTQKYVEVQYYCEQVEDKVTDPPYTVIKETTTVPSTTARPPSTRAPIVEDKVTDPPYTVIEKTTTVPSTTARPLSTMAPTPEPTTVTTTEEAEHHGEVGGKFCARTGHGEHSFPRTKAGLTRKVKCGTAQVGDVLWTCGSDGSWVGQPDITGCVSKWLDDLTGQDVPVSEAMTQLNSGLQKKALGSGDLRKATRDLLPGLMSKIQRELDTPMSPQDRREKIHNYNRDMVRSGSGLLDSKLSASWRSLEPLERHKSATSLIVSLEQMALQVATTIEEPTTLTSTEQNIVMEVSVLRLSSTRSADLKLPMMQQEIDADQGRHDFSLPLDTLADITDNDEVTVMYLLYNNLETLMNPLAGQEDRDSMGVNPKPSVREINSRVVSASVTKHTSTAQGPHGRTPLSRPMNFTLSHKQGLGDKEALCAYWSYNETTLNGDWSTDGCRVVQSTDESTTCQCDHLTNFAVLMDVTGVKIDRFHKMSLTAITYVGCGVSIICLIMCFISFSIFRNLQSDRNTIHKNLVLCLALANLLFLFGIGQTGDKVGCAVIAGFLHLLFLASFSWMCLEGVQLYFMLIEVFESERSRVRWFYLFGYGFPALIVGISAAAYPQGYGTELHCWLSTENYFILSFVVPVGIVVMLNAVMLTIAVYMMCRHAGVTASAIQARQKGKLEKIGNGNESVVSDNSSVSTVEMLTWLKGSAVLVVLLGLTWTFGFLYVNSETLVMAYIFTLLNSLQGLFIFIFHCFMDRKVKKEWRRAITRAKWLPMCCRINLGTYNGSLSPTPTSSSGGPHNYFMKFWSGRKRKRSSMSTSSGRNRRSYLDSFLRSDTSSGCTQGTGLNRYSNQSDKLIPNGQNVYSAMPTFYEGGMVGDLSVADCSVVDSEFVTEYCQKGMAVVNEKKEYETDSENEEGNTLAADAQHDNVNKRLSYLSLDSNQKLHSECVSDTEEGKVNIAVLDDIDTSVDKKQMNKTDSERNLLNDFLTLYHGKNGVPDPSKGISASQKKLDSLDTPKSEDSMNTTKSAPNLKLPNFTQFSNQNNDGSTTPLLGSLPDLSSAPQEEEQSCSKSVNIASA